MGPKPPNPAELIGSEKMKNLLSIMKKYYDYILIDSSPASLFSDARIIANLADGTILVTAENEANLDLIRTTLDSLEQVKVNIIGFILNKSNILESKVHGYGYGYGYGYGHRRRKTHNGES